MANKEITYNFAVDSHTDKDFEFLITKLEAESKTEVFEVAIHVLAQMIRVKGIGFILRYLISRNKTAERSLFD